MIAMIFLVLLTLVVISAIKATTINTKVVGNIQIQKESEAVAQQAIETVISTDFTKSPMATSVQIDINNSGQTASTYVVPVPAPTCVSVKPIKLSELELSDAEDVPCYVSGAAQNTGIVGAATGGNSLCSRRLSSSSIVIFGISARMAGFATFSSLNVARSTAPSMSPAAMQ